MSGVKQELLSIKIHKTDSIDVAHIGIIFCYFILKVNIGNQPIIAIIDSHLHLINHIIDQMVGSLCSPIAPFYVQQAIRFYIRNS